MKPNGGRHSTISVRQRIGTPKSRSLYTSSDPRFERPWCFEDPEPQPRRRDRLEVPGVGEERECLVDVDRHHLRSFKHAIRNQGISTLLITWMTPLEAVTFGVMTVAPPTITLPPLTRIESDLPSRVFAE